MLNREMVIIDAIDDDFHLFYFACLWLTDLILITFCLTDCEH